MAQSKATSGRRATTGTGKVPSPAIPDATVPPVLSGDAGLMPLIQRGNLSAFERFYEYHVAIALALAMRIVHDRDLAQDAVQEGFLGFWRGRAGYKPGIAPARSWLLTIVRNRAIDIHRRESARRAVAGGGGATTNLQAADCTEAEVIARADHEALRAQMQRLPRTQCEVIELAYFGGLTHREIAQALELPAGTVKGRLRLGLEKLRVARAQGGAGG